MRSHSARPMRVGSAEDAPAPAPDEKAEGKSRVPSWTAWSGMRAAAARRARPPSGRARPPNVANERGVARATTDGDERGRECGPPGGVGGRSRFKPPDDDFDGPRVH